LYFLLHKNTGVLVGDHMKKRAFLLPLAASLAALVGAEAQASVPAATLPISQPAMEGPAIAGSPAPAPLVLQRSNDQPTFARHGSHSSHASHASHSSHYSSR
jgi:hypothetical protein